MIGEDPLSDHASTRMSFKSPLPVINPASVAIVGASERARWPTDIFNNLNKGGFPGKIFPVNPRASEVWGQRAYPDLASLPEAPSHALVIVPSTAVIDVLEKGVAAGLKSATIYSGNLGEGTDPESVARGQAVSDIVARSGLIVNGPNCMGGNSLHHRFFGYPNHELVGLPKGGVAYVSQSGGMVQFFVKSAAERGVKFSAMFSSGNELDLDLADFVNHLVDDADTKIIGLFIEGIRRPQAFMRAAARALAAGKPIIALKTGKSAKSRAAAQSHTGAISGDYEGFLALCERYGIIACPSLDDMVETVLAFQGGRLPRGPRVGWITTSGGTVDLLYDYIEEIGGTQAPEFGAEAAAVMRPIVPAEIGIKNPLDAGIPSTDENAIAMCAAAANDPQIDMIAWAAVLPSSKRQPNAEILRSLLDRTDKPVIAFGRMAYALGPDSLDFQDKVGFPYLQGLPETIRAMGAMAFYGARAGRKVEELPAPRGSALEATQLGEALASHGLTPPASGFGATPQAAADMAARIGFPVALKLVSPQISHKTEVGGVRIGLGSAEEVMRAAQDIIRTVGERAPDAVVEGFLVQEMARGVEVLIGVRTDPLYGPMMVVGSGGVFVELMKDISCRLLPVGPAQAREMIGELKLAKLLAGYRGAAPADMEALVRAICGLSDFYIDHRHTLSDLEVNPLIVLEEGKGVRAVDIRSTPV